MVGIVAAGAGREAVGVDGDGEFGSGEKDGGGGDEIPGVGGEDIEGEQVEVAGMVALFAGESVAEAAEVASTFAGGEAFDLDAEVVLAVFDADVVGAGVAPGLGDGEAALGGGVHEAEFDPFSALLVGFETFPVIHVARVQRRKARLWRPRLRFSCENFFLLSTYRIAS